MAFEISKLTRLYLGYVGENESRIIDIDVSDWLEQWPDAIIAMTVQRPKENNTYIPVTEVNGGVLSWTVRREDVAIAGNGMAQIRAIQPSTGRVYMSRVVPTVIAASMTGEIDDGAVPPESGWVNTVLMAAADAQQSEDDAKGHADRAEAAVADLEQTRADAIADVLQTAETETSKATAAIAQKGADTLASIPEDYTSLAADVGQLSEDISAGEFVIDLTKYGPINATLENGIINPYGTNRVSTEDFVSLGNAVKLSVAVADGYKFGIHFYKAADEVTYIADLGGWVNASRTILPPAGANFARFIWAYASDGAITPEQMPLTVTKYGFEYAQISTAAIVGTNFAKPKIHKGKDFFALNQNKTNVASVPTFKVPAETSFVWKNILCSVTTDVIIDLLPSSITSGQAIFVKKPDGAGQRHIVDADDFRAVAWNELPTVNAEEYLYICEVQLAYGDATGALDIGLPWYYNGQLFGLIDLEEKEKSDSEKVLTMSYPDGAEASQDIEIYGEYMFVAFSGNECIQVYSLENKKALATMTVNVLHGSGMQFSGEYYAESDPFPLLYVGGWTDQKINVIRITNFDGVWAAEIVRTLLIPAENGYYPAPSIDAEHNILYCYGYKQPHIQAEDNGMMLSKYDLSRLTDNGDGTYTPEKLSVKGAPYLGVMQGRKYYQGRLYVGFSNASTPFNSRLVIVDTNTGKAKSDVDMAWVTESENEGVCYQVKDNNVYWYYSDYYNVYKLTINLALEVNQLARDVADGLLTKADVIVDTMQGAVCSTDVASDAPLQGLRVYGKTTQAETPTPNAPVPMVNVGDGGSIAVSVVTAAEDERPQILALSTPNGLPGVPITTGGNYTDADGQQWLCDEIDLNKGVYIQRCVKQIITGGGTDHSFGRIYVAMAEKYKVQTPGLCNVCTYKDLSSERGYYFSNGSNGLYFAYNDVFATAEAFNSFAAANPIECIVALAQPVEIPLTAEEIAAYRAMHTNKPNTTAYNDAGAWQQVDYAADTKLYIDGKFAALEAAILSQGGV